MSSSTRITTYQSLWIQLVQNAPDDGPVRSETCRANKKRWIKLTHYDHIVYLVGLHIYSSKPLWQEIYWNSIPLFLNLGFCFLYVMLHRFWHKISRREGKTLSLRLRYYALRSRFLEDQGAQHQRWRKPHIQHDFWTVALDRRVDTAKLLVKTCEFWTHHKTVKNDLLF